MLNAIPGERVYQLMSDAPETDAKTFAEVWPGLDRFSIRLLKILDRVPASTPLLISGDWGAGKTTLLKAVQRRLWDKQQTVIWFEAWRYDGPGTLLPALMRTVWESAPDDWKSGHVDVVDRLLRAAASVGLRAAPELLRLAGVPIIPDLLSGASEAIKENEGLLRSPHEPPPDPVQTLWQAFANLMQEAWQDKPPPVIMLDDLDRCDPSSIVAVLENIRLLVGSAHDLHCRFIVALDRHIVVQAVAKKFEGISGYDGNRYLEKLFPLSFNLPTPTSQDVSRLIEHVGVRGQSSQDRDHRDALASALSEKVFANPRLIKRCVNKYRLIQDVEGEGQTEAPQAALPNNNQNRYLSRWIAATERWPRLRTLLVRQNDEFWDSFSKRIHEPALDPELKSLLDEDGARGWLLKEILNNTRSNIALYRQAENRLQAVGL